MATKKQTRFEYYLKQNNSREQATFLNFGGNFLIFEQLQSNVWAHCEVTFTEFTSTIYSCLIRVSKYPLHSVLRSLLGEGLSFRLRILVSSLFRGAASKWQGILELLQYLVNCVRERDDINQISQQECSHCLLQMKRNFYLIFKGISRVF